MPSWQCKVCSPVMLQCWCNSKMLVNTSISHSVLVSEYKGECLNDTVYSYPGKMRSHEQKQSKLFLFLEETCCYFCPSCCMWNMGFVWSLISHYHIGQLILWAWMCAQIQNHIFFPCSVLPPPKVKNISHPHFQEEMHSGKSICSYRQKKSLLDSVTCVLNSALIMAVCFLPPSSVCLWLPHSRVSIWNHTAATALEEGVGGGWSLSPALAIDDFTESQCHSLAFITATLALHIFGIRHALLAVIVM